ncbi:DUF7260 family protein [Halorubrum sp. DTA46]|uniref:DUF7260 family protein n=1 Tax=Halorubrum sp. DTA46 TaxID=3402162 RepID=UPI003AAB7448
MSSSPGSAAAFRIPSHEPAVTECASLSCTLGEVVTEPGAVTAVVIAGLVAIVAFAYVRDAKETARRERRRVLDERDAFEEFAARVADLDPAPAELTTTAFDGSAVGVKRADRVAGSGRGGDVRLRRVLAAYRDTVMSLPHYRAEYDETIPESLAAELGPDAATSLASNGTLSTGAQSALTERSRHAATARSDLAEAIGAEIDALTDAEAELACVDRRRRRLIEHLDGVEHDRTGAAIDVWERLDDLEGECEELAAERQRALDDPPMTPDLGSGQDDDRAFYSYLYGGGDGPRFPVLAQVSELAERVRADADRVASQVSRGG